MKISTRISITLFISAVLLATVTDIFIYYYAKKHITARIHLILTEIASEEAGHIRSIVSGHKALFSTAVTSEKAFAIHPGSSPDHEALKGHLQELISLGEGHVFSARLVDRSGEIISFQMDRSVMPGDWQEQAGEGDIYSITDRLYRPDAMDSLSVEGPVVSPVLSSPCLVITIPVVTDGMQAGAVIIEHDMDDIYGVISRGHTIWGTVESYLINRDGLMISPSRFSVDSFLKQKVDTRNARICMDQNYDRQDSDPSSV